MNIQFTYESIIHYLQTAVDIICVWILLNYIIKVAKTSQKTVQLFQGVVFILVLRTVTQLLGLSTISWLANNIVSWGFLAIIVLFQPEIRGILERLGKSNALARISVLSAPEKERLVDELVAATASLSASKTGALITLEQGNSLKDYIETGVAMNSIVSAELLCSIFVTSTPLHDGAVIIQGDKLACASAYFPPTSMELPSRYGARHRAAIGISEVTDAVTIVVSEESGRVALTTGGRIIQMNESKLRTYLEKIILNKETVVAQKTDRVSSAQSVTVDNLIEQSSLAEIEFKNDDRNKFNNKEMKTFQSTDFKSEIEEAEKRIKKNDNISQSGVIKKIVQDIASERDTAHSNTGEIPAIRIKTVSVPKTREKKEAEAREKASENTIKTERVVDGTASQKEGGAQ